MLGTSPTDCSWLNCSPLKVTIGCNKSFVSRCLAMNFFSFHLEPQVSIVYDLVACQTRPCCMCVKVYSENCCPLIFTLAVIMLHVFKQCISSNLESESADRNPNDNLSKWKLGSLGSFIQYHFPRSHCHHGCSSDHFLSFIGRLDNKRLLFNLRFFHPLDAALALNFSVSGHLVTAT